MASCTGWWGQRRKSSVLICTVVCSELRSATWLCVASADCIWYAWSVFLWFTVRSVVMDNLQYQCVCMVFIRLQLVFFLNHLLAGVCVCVCVCVCKIIQIWSPCMAINISFYNSICVFCSWHRDKARESPLQPFMFCLHAQGHERQNRMNRCQTAPVSISQNFFTSGFSLVEI